MKAMLVAISLLALSLNAEISGQHVSDHGTGVDVQPNSVGHVETGAVQAKVNIQPRALTGVIRIDKGVEVNVPPGAVQVQVEPITITAPPISFTTAPDTIRIVFPPEAVKVTLTIADGALRIDPTVAVTVEKGAVTLTGAEAGAVQTKIEWPWWATVAVCVAIVFAVCYAVTKARKATVRAMVRGQTSWMDIPF